MALGIISEKSARGLDNENHDGGVENGVVKDFDIPKKRFDTRNELIFVMLSQLFIVF